MASVEKKLSLGEKLGYALGDAAANFVLQMRLAFLTHFYTDAYGLSSSSVALVQGVAATVDAFNNVVMGALSDRTQTRWGKFRPWILCTAFPLGLASYLAFAGPELGSTGKLIYAAITLNLMVIIYGANNIPYSALGGVISDDPDERVSVASWRFYFAMGTAFIVLKNTWDMKDYFGGGDEARGYRLTMAVWSALAVLCALVTFFATRERIVNVRAGNTSLLKDFDALLANTPWRVLAVSTFLIHICLGMRGSVIPYYFEYVLLQKDLLGNFHAVGMVSAMVGIFSSTGLARRYGKRNVFCIGLLVSALCTIFFYLLTGEHYWSIFAVQIAFSVSFGLTSPLMWAMIADVADFTEWQNSRRITALTFAATLFFFKIGEGIGMVLTPLMLEAVGYQAKLEQTATAIQGIRLMISFLPAALLFASGVVILRYLITHEVEREMTAALRQRREEMGLAVE